MTNILIIQGHPDPAATHLCHAIAAAYLKSAEAAGHAVTLIAVAQHEVPLIHSRADWESDDLPAVALTGQAAVQEAGHIVLIYPLWMGDMPALLKGWFEQVFRQDFAFAKAGKSWRPALRGKSAQVIVTMGMPAMAYRWFYMAHSLRSLDRNILRFCGIKPVRWSIFGNAEDPTGAAQKGFLAKASQLGARAG